MTTAGEVPHEDEPPPLGVGAVLPVAEVSQEIVEGLDLAVGIADDIDGAFEEGADEGHGGVPDGDGGMALMAWVRGSSDSPFFVWEMPGWSRRIAR